MSSGNRNNNASNATSNSASGGSSGDGFWAKNGPSIMSATGSAISTTFKAGKYVAKTGYSAGKSHYNNQKGKSSGAQEAPAETEEVTSSNTSTNSFINPNSFHPPPLRPGQSQYQRGGKLVEAGETPVARPHESQMQQALSNGNQPQQYYNNGAPQQQYYNNGAFQQQYGANTAPSPQQQQYGANTAPSPQQQQYGANTAPSPQQQQYGANTAPPQQQQQYDANTAPQQQQYGANTAPQQQQYGANTAPEQQQYGANTAPQQQQYGANTAPQQQQYGANTAPQQQQYGANTAPQQQQYGANTAPQQQQYGANTAPQQQQYGANTAPQQQQYGANAAPQQQPYGANAAPQQQQYGANAAPQQQQYGANAAPQQQPQVPSANGSPQNPTNTSAGQNLQPLYDAQGAIIGYIPPQNQVSSTNTIDTVNQRPAALLPEGITNSPNESFPPPSAAIPQRLDFSTLPPRTSSQQNINREPPSIPQKTLSVLTPDNASSRNSGSPHYEAKPYEYIEPEEREKSTKIIIENKVDVTKMPPPPLHMGRGSSLEKKFSELVDEKIKSQSSTINTYSSSPSASSRTSRLNIAIPDIDSEEEDNRHNAEKNVSVAPKLEIRENDTTNATESLNEKSLVLGKYDYSKKVDFQPPPKASIPDGFVSPSTRHENMKQESENKRHVTNTNNRQLPPRPSTSRGSSVSSAPKLPPSNSRVAPQSSTVKRPEQSKAGLAKVNVQEASRDTVEKSAVSGNYDYSRQVNFQPPPMAKRSERDMEFIQQKQERSRITSNSNLRQPKTQTPATRKAMTILEPEESTGALPQQAAPEANPPAYSRMFGQSNSNDFLPPPQRSQVNAYAPPPKPSKPSQLNSSALPPKPNKPSQISASKPPPKPSKPGMLKAPPKPKKPSSIQIEKTNSDDNPFAKYDPKSAV